jgi:hypothetical protein
MADNDSLAWFHQLSSMDDKVLLLSNPRGELPVHLVARLSRLAVAPTMITEAAGRTLTPSRADQLAAQRQRLDAWWRDTTPEQRAGLIEHHGGLIPSDYRPAVMDCIPGGVINADDLTAPFPLPPMMAVYVEWKAPGETTT